MWCARWAVSSSSSLHGRWMGLLFALLRLPGARFLVPLPRTPITRVSGNRVGADRHQPASQPDTSQTDTSQTAIQTDIAGLVHCTRPPPVGRNHTHTHTRARTLVREYLYLKSLPLPSLAHSLPRFFPSLPFPLPFPLPLPLPSL